MKTMLLGGLIMIMVVLGAKSNLSIAQDDSTAALREVNTFGLGFAFLVDIHPTEDRVAMVNGGDLLILDKDFNLLNRLPLGPHNLPEEIVFSPDGTKIAVSGIESSLTRIWNTADYSTLAEFSSYITEDYPLSWSPDSQLIAAGSDRSIGIYDSQNGQIILVFSL